MLKIILPSSAAIAIIVTVILIMMNRTSVDPATAATSDANLQKQTLPSNLPQLAFVPERSGSGGASFDKLLEQTQAAGRYIGQGGFAEESRAESVKLYQVMVELAASMPLEAGFADQKIGPRDLNDPELKKDLTLITNALKLHTDVMIEQRKYDEAAEAAGACFALGKELFENNTRLRPRQAGLMMMRVSLATWLRIAKSQSEFGQITADEFGKIKTAAQPWLDAIRVIETVWDQKLKSIDIPDPSVGDLIRVAQKDQDLSFRVFAVRRLGLARFEHGDASNKKAINDAISAAKSSDDAMVRSAAETAEKLTIEQFRQVTR